MGRRTGLGDVSGACVPPAAERDLASLAPVSACRSALFFYGCRTAPRSVRSR